jgi:exodeoxyribonuclease X
LTHSKIIRVVDFETTGSEPPAEVCEVGICDVDIDDRSIGDWKSWLCGVQSMPPDVRAIHHISKEDCEGFPPFNQDTLDDDKVSVFVAHNADFELKFFSTPKPVICTYKCALRVWPDAPTHSNNGLRYWLQDQGKITPDHDNTMPTHRAGPDAYVTAWLFVALLNEGVTGKEMVQWTKEPKKLPKCTIGKFRGVPWSDVDAGFLSWMLRQPDMDADLKWNAMQEINRRDAA